jgi:hypothetical protein
MVSHLATLPGLVGLTELVLVSFGFSDGALRNLFKSPYLSGLKYLDLGDYGIGPREVRELASNPSLAGLVNLILRRDKIGVAGARAILESPHLRQSLKRLRLYGNFDGSESGEGEVLKALAEWLGDGLRLGYDEKPNDD